MTTIQTLRKLVRDRRCGRSIYVPVDFYRRAFRELTGNDLPGSEFWPQFLIVFGIQLEAREIDEPCFEDPYVAPDYTAILKQKIAEFLAEQQKVDTR